MLDGPRRRRPRRAARPGRARRRSAPTSRSRSRRPAASPRCWPSCGTLADRNEVVTSLIGAGLPRHPHARRDPAQRARVARLVHGLHAVPARDQPGPARGAPQLPDDGHATSPGMDIANASMLDESTAAAEAMTLIRRSTKHASADVLRRRRDAPADHRRGGGPGRADRHRPRGRHRSRSSTPPPASVRSSSTPAPRASSATSPRRIAAVHAAGGLVAVATDLLACTLLVPPGRAGRRRGGRLVAALRRAARLRRPARRVPRHPRGPAPLDARSPRRRVGRRRGSPRAPARAPDPRAAHPAGEGHVEHLHRAGAPRRDRLDVRRVPRARGPAGDRRAGPPPRRVAGPVAAATPGSRSTATSSTRSPCACPAGADEVAGRRAAARRQPAHARRPHRRASPSTRPPPRTCSSGCAAAFGASLLGGETDGARVPGRAGPHLASTSRTRCSPPTAPRPRCSATCARWRTRTSPSTGR